MVGDVDGGIEEKIPFPSTKGDLSWLSPSGLGSFCLSRKAREPYLPGKPSLWTARILPGGRSPQLSLTSPKSLVSQNRAGSFHPGVVPWLEGRDECGAS